MDTGDLIILCVGETWPLQPNEGFPSWTGANRMKAVAERTLTALPGATRQIPLRQVFNGTITSLEERVEFKEWGLAFYSIK